MVRSPLPPDALAGARVLVVGASAGIGRAIAAQARSSGADVVMAARRTEQLDVLVAEHGGVAVATDVTDEAQCGRLAERVGVELGGLDLVIVATGATLLRRVIETSADDWTRIFATNVIGCNQVVRAVAPLVEPGGIVAVLSSEDAVRVRAGLAAYAASKAALERSIESWRIEHSPLRFATIAIGATLPTEISDAMDGELLSEMLERWIRSGHIQNAMMETDELASAVLGVLSSLLPYHGVGVEHLVLRAPAGYLGDPDPGGSGSS